MLNTSNKWQNIKRTLSTYVSLFSLWSFTVLPGNDELVEWETGGKNGGIYLKRPSQHTHNQCHPPFIDKNCYVSISKPCHTKCYCYYVIGHEFLGILWYSELAMIRRCLSLCINTSVRLLQTSKLAFWYFWAVILHDNWCSGHNRG